MTAAAFLCFVAALAGAVVLAARRYLDRGAATQVTVAVPVWLAYVGALGWFGVLGNPALRPPGPLYLLGPVVLFMVVFAVRSRAGLRTALALPLALLLGAQAFRVAVELFLHQLWSKGLVPGMMTYEGGNFDIAIGLSAPLLAWLHARGRLGTKALLAWNIAGLLTLANVAVRAIFTAPGPLQLIYAEVPNRAVGMFPYIYIAGLFAPLAVLMHVLAIRALRHRGSASSDAPAVAPAPAGTGS
jgi:hypothetical protein